VKLRRPTLLFIMGEDYSPLRKRDLEDDPALREKLEAFRERAKIMSNSDDGPRLYGEFNSPEEFSTMFANAIGDLRRIVPPIVEDDRRTEERKRGEDTDGHGDGLPGPPALAALPEYLGSHKFVGRENELGLLDEWCDAADPNPLLLFQAIGGSGKSMLTWEWVTQRATRARGDRAGRLWYSFYQQDADMAGFCRYALAYMTKTPLAEYARLSTAVLSKRLLNELKMRPWLIVLDGLERILVAYHRHDAPAVPDSKVDAATDQIGDRDPRRTTSPDDGNLLRDLAGVAPSKVLVSSRLLPVVLVNNSGTAVPGVRRESLGGLRPGDAVEMITKCCHVRGDHRAIQAYLQTNCDCHPLTIGALAGLINDYLPDRGNFDRWVADPRGGGVLNLAQLNLIQKRNHILEVAIDALSDHSLQLLRTLSMLHGGAAFDLLEAVNPHLPPQPKEVPQPTDPTQRYMWAFLSEARKIVEKAEYAAAVAKRRRYLEELEIWRNDPAVRAAPDRLAETVRDLERRGLLQYDGGGKRYDLHPVVRGVVRGRMADNDKEKHGQPLVDYLSNRPHDPWEQAETLAGVEPGLQIVRTFVDMGKYEEAVEAYSGGLGSALLNNLGAYAAAQELLKPFFPDGWDREPIRLSNITQSYLFLDAGNALSDDFPEKATSLLNKSISINLKYSRLSEIITALITLNVISWDANRMAEQEKLLSISELLSEEIEIEDDNTASIKAKLCHWAIEIGNFDQADRIWEEFKEGLHFWNEASIYHSAGLFYRGKLTEEALVGAEIGARKAFNYTQIRNLYRLRGQWSLARHDAPAAAQNFAEAVRMSLEAGADPTSYEIELAFARVRAGDQLDALSEAVRLSQAIVHHIAAPTTGMVVLAELWEALSQRTMAVKYALEAHRVALADGEPYVRRYWLNRTRELLTRLGVDPLPEVPRYDPSKARPFPWEKELQALIDKLKAEREDRKRAERAEENQESRNP
jgi:hypothetical protein